MKKKNLFLSMLLTFVLAFGITISSVYAFALGNNGIFVSDGGNISVDIDNNEKGVIIINGTSTSTIYNKGLIVSGSFKNIIDQGGFYGLVMNLTNLTVSDLSYSENKEYAEGTSCQGGIYTYNDKCNVKCMVMPYNTEYSFTLSSTDGNNLPCEIEISVSNNDDELVEGVDYTYDSNTGKVVINKDRIVVPMVLTASSHTHVFDKEIVDEKYKKSDATCESPAVYYKSCECGEKGTETFESGKALGHVSDEKFYSDGTWHYNKCINCNVVLNKEKHQFEWVVDKNATNEEEGQKHQECSICGYKTNYQSIPITTLSDKSTDSVNTADESNLFIWIIGVITSVCALFGISIYKVKLNK